MGKAQSGRRTGPEEVSELGPHGAEQDTHDFPHGLGWHAGVAVNQGLCGLGKGVGDAVAEALSQAGPAKTAGGVGLRGGAALPSTGRDLTLP